MTTPRNNSATNGADPFAGWDAPFRPQEQTTGSVPPPAGPPPGPAAPHGAPQPPPFVGGQGAGPAGGAGGGRSRTTNRTTNRTKNYNVHVGGQAGGGNGGGGQNGGGGGGGGNAGAATAGDGRHQGDSLIYTIERIEITSDKDVLELGKAINHLGRELYLILGMRAEEIQGVLSTYKGRWYTFGAGSRVRARLVAAHLKVSAEAAKAIGVGALKMSAAFHRHFIQPEQEAKRRRQAPTRKAFTIGDD